MSIKNIAGVVKRVVKSGATSVARDKDALAVFGLTIGAIGCVEIGYVLTKREYEEKEGKEPEKSLLREMWDDTKGYVGQLAATLAVCGLINGITDEVVLPALKAKYPDKYM